MLRTLQVFPQQKRKESFFLSQTLQVLPVSVSQQNVYYTSSQQLHLGVLSPTIDDDDNKCLVDVNSKPRLLECSYAATKHMKLTWTFTQVKTHSSCTCTRPCSQLNPLFSL